MNTSKNHTFLEAKITHALLIADGSITVTVRQKGKMTGPATEVKFERDLVFYKHSSRIDIRMRLDKPETEHKESCHVAFPFAGQGGTFKVDQNIGIYAEFKEKVRRYKREIIPGLMQTH